MPCFLIALSSVDDVKSFVGAAATLPCEVDATRGRYVVNAKSIMGLFSMDLSGPIEVTVHGTALQTEQLKGVCAPFLV